MSQVILSVKRNKTLKSQSSIKSAVRTDAAARILPEGAAYKTVSVNKIIEAVQLQGQQLPMPNDFISDGMSWEVSVGADKIIFWSASVKSRFGKLTEKPNAATVGWYDFAEIEKIQAGNDEEYGAGINITVDTGTFQTWLVIEAPVEILRVLAGYMADSMKNYFADKISDQSASSNIFSEFAQYPFEIGGEDLNITIEGVGGAFTIASPPSSS